MIFGGLVTLGETSSTGPAVSKTVAGGGRNRRRKVDGGSPKNASIWARPVAVRREISWAGRKWDGAGGGQARVARRWSETPKSPVAGSWLTFSLYPLFLSLSLTWGIL